MPAVPAPKARRPSVLWRALWVLLVALVLGALLAVLWWRGTGRTPRAGSLQLPILEQPVEVHFDGAAVPHVFAASARDLARAVGYLHAAERGTQMELGRRYAAGRLAEVLGADLVETDVRARTLGLYRAAARTAERLGPDSRAFLEHYAEGVNARLEGGDRPPLMRLLGIEPEPWTPVDSLAFASLMALELAMPLDQEWSRLGWWQRDSTLLERVYAWGDLHTDGAAAVLAHFGAPAVAPDSATTAEPGGQSNNWAVGPSRSADGSALLAGDPHLELMLPPRWYQVCLKSPEYEAMGFTLPGIPVVVVGQSALRAWSVTTTGLDGEDTFAEDFDPKGGTVRRGDERRAAERRVETVMVRGGDPLELELWSTELGPMLPPNPERGRPWRSLAWTLYESEDPLALFLALAKEPELDAVWRASETYTAPAQNLLVAEAGGTIAYTVIGRAPRRGLGDGRLPAPAWDRRYHWQGLVPAAENPRRVDPPEAHLATANADVRPEGYGAPFTADFAHPSRRDRLAEVLGSRADWDPAAFASLQLDVQSPYALELARGLSTALAGGELSPAGQEALGLLSAWDGRVLEVGSPAAALFHLVVVELVEVWREDWFAAGSAPFGALRDGLPRLLTEPLETEEQKERAARVAKALDLAVARAEALLGSDRSAWEVGRLQRLWIPHALSDLPLLGPRIGRGPFPFGGHDSTVNVAWTRAGDGGLRVQGAASLRFVAHAKDPDRSLGILPGGQSGHPFDPHYDDQLESWRAGRLRPMHFSRAAVEAASASVLWLMP